MPFPPDSAAAGASDEFFGPLENYGEASTNLLMGPQGDGRFPVSGALPQRNISFVCADSLVSGADDPGVRTAAFFDAMRTPAGHPCTGKDSGV